MPLRSPLSLAATVLAAGLSLGAAAESPRDGSLFMRYDQLCRENPEHSAQAYLRCHALREFPEDARAEIGYWSEELCRKIRFDCQDPRNAQLRRRYSGYSERMGCREHFDLACSDEVERRVADFDLCGGQARLSKLLISRSGKAFARIEWKDESVTSSSDLPYPGDRALQEWMRKNALHGTSIENGYEQLVRTAINQNCEKFRVEPSRIPFWNYVFGSIRRMVQTWCPGGGDCLPPNTPTGSGGGRG